MAAHMADAVQQRWRSSSSIMHMVLQPGWRGVALHCHSLRLLLLDVSLQVCVVRVL
jgi:hypothetical protein